MTTNPEKEPKQIKLLKSLWKKRTKRSSKLIVPTVTSSTPTLSGSLNTDDWAFDVHFAFRDALDISYDERTETKDKKIVRRYMLWTQGPIIHFKEGDLIHSMDGKTCVQVKLSNPMGWDQSKDEMYQGIVTFDIFEKSEGKIVPKDSRSTTQMDFLKILISGL